MKFVAILRILVQELSTLASGFEVDGGQLRFQASSLVIFFRNRPSISNL